MKILIISVGKKHEKSLATAIKDYSNRINFFTDLDWKLIPPEKYSDVEKTKKTETESIEKLLHIDDFVILTDEHGQLISTDDLTEIISYGQNQSYKRMVMIIGGPRGVNSSLFNRADKIIALSRMTLPHQIVRLMVVEQLYRSHSILANHPYHYR